MGSGDTLVARRQVLISTGAGRIDTGRQLKYKHCES